VPELALSIALHQFLVARRYYKLVNATPGRKMPVATAFYVVMRGFAYGINGTAIRTMRLLDIVKPEVIDHIRTFSINDIRDKSKRMAL